MTTSLQLAEQIVMDLASSVRSGEWTFRKPKEILALSKALETIVETAYADGYRNALDGKEPRYKTEDNATTQHDHNQGETRASLA